MLTNYNCTLKKSIVSFVAFLGKKRAARDGSANQVRKSILHERKKPVIFRAGRLSDLACN